MVILSIFNFNKFGLGPIIQQMTPSFFHPFQSAYYHTIVCSYILFFTAIAGTSTSGSTSLTTTKVSQQYSANFALPDSTSIQKIHDAQTLIKDVLKTKAADTQRLAEARTRAAEMMVPLQMCVITVYNDFLNLLLLF
jgi:hypothetical protein